MAAPQATREHYRASQLLTARAVRVALLLWGRVDPDRLAESWAAIAPALYRVVVQAQLAAVNLAQGYVPTVLGELDIDADAQGQLRRSALAGIASDGRDLEPLLYSAVAQARQARYRFGGNAPAARRIGGDVLTRIVATQVQDAGRVAVGVEAMVRPAVGGYTRQLTLPSCSRCIVLAGRWYRTNQGFQRHPACDCVHIPAREDLAGDLTTSPRSAFDSLTPAEQDRVFTAAGARAIRDGADISQVVNARRGANGLSLAGGRLTRAEQDVLTGGGRGRLRRTDVFGQQIFTTTEGTTTRGVAGRALAGDGTDRVPGSRYRSVRTPRLMPEAIYELAGPDRAEAIRLLRRFGYLT
jgi:hypothetical protein